jgi:hypothetical protein
MATADKSEVVIEGKIRQFFTGGKGKPRFWVTAEMTYRDAKRIIKIDRYNAENDKGIQRAGIESWQNQLSKKMDGGEFTPNPWAAGVLKSHLKDVGPIEAGKTIKLVVSPRNPLISLDGQQRQGAMEKLLKKAEGDAEKTKAILDSYITFPVYLDHQYTYADFLNLQYGRPVDASHMLSMQLAHDKVDEKKKPYLMLAKETAKLVDDNESSPFSGKIKFDSSDDAPLALKAVTTLGGSDISTSFGGGAKLALKFEKDAAWLANMYVSAYQAIIKHGSKDEVESELEEKTAKVPTLLRKGKMLYTKGKKGSLSLHIGIGNMLAYRMARLGRDEVKPADAKLFVECLEDIFDMEVDGNLSGPDKRRIMGRFVDRYFGDLARRTEEDETDKKKLDCYTNGSMFWPTELVDLLSKSSLGVPQSAVKNGFSATDDEDEDEDEVDEDGTDETEEEATDEEQVDEEEGEDETDAEASIPIDNEEEQESDDESEFEPATATPPTPPARGGKRGGKSPQIMG